MSTVHRANSGSAVTKPLVIPSLAQFKVISRPQQSESVQQSSKLSPLPDSEPGSRRSGRGWPRAPAGPRRAPLDRDLRGPS